MIVLHPVGGQEGAAPIRTARARITFGREPENDVVVDEQRWPTVSGQHAKIVFENDWYHLVDVGSRNGTFVNGEKVVEAQPLKRGDLVRLGLAPGPEYRVDFEVPGEPAPAAPGPPVPWVWIAVLATVALLVVAAVVTLVVAGG